MGRTQKSCTNTSANLNLMVGSENQYKIECCIAVPEKEVDIKASTVKIVSTQGIQICFIGIGCLKRAFLLQFKDTLQKH